MHKRNDHLKQMGHEEWEYEERKKGELYYERAKKEQMEEVEYSQQWVKHNQRE